MSEIINAVDAILRSRIEWDGDLGDDCTAEWRGFGAHSELMSDTDDDGNPSGETWFCSVWRINPNGKVGSDNQQLFHSTEEDLLPLSGDAARSLCERIMRFQALIDQK